MENEIREFFEINLPSIPSIAILVDTFKTYSRGRIIAYADHKEKSRTQQLTEPEAQEKEDIDVCAAPPFPKLLRQINTQTELLKKLYLKTKQWHTHLH